MNRRFCGACQSKIRAAAGGGEVERARKRRYYQENREKVLPGIYARRHANPALISGHRPQRAERAEAVSDGSLTPEVVRQMFAAAKECPYCMGALTWRNRTLDHIQPLIRGGAHSVKNALVCCRPCNSAKNAADISVWLTRVAVRYGEAARQSAEAAVAVARRG